MVDDPQKPAPLTPLRGGATPLGVQRRRDPPRRKAAVLIREDAQHHGRFLPADVPFTDDDRAIGRKGAAHTIAVGDATPGLAGEHPSHEATAGLVDHLFEELRGLKPADADPHLVDLAFGRP